MPTVVMYRTAHHPEYVRLEVEPALTEAGSPMSLSPVISGLIDALGGTPELWARRLRSLA